MRDKSYRSLFIAITYFLHFSNACQMDGVSNWLIPVQVSVRDVDRGSFFTAATSDVLEITSISNAEGLNSGPYIDVRLEGSQFVISTNDAYAQYEENETAMSMGVTVNMRCTTGTGFLVFMIDIIDTNNNAPQYRPSNELEFTIAPPVPPGFLITGCLDDIIARDIDLTTQRVEFEIDPNPYFEIYYNAASSTVPKEFKANLRTTNFIRSLPEPVVVRIRATDVDDTGDPPLTSEATLRIIGNTEFELPEEPVFTKTYYLAEISGNQLQHEPISLLQGYSSEIEFNLDGEYSEFFDISPSDNQVTLSIQSTLPDYLLEQTQIYLAVKAERNLTSGASATVILQMPEPRQLGFEKDTYNGIVRDNVLTHDPIVLNMGYNSDIEFEIKSDFPYFNLTKNGNEVTIIIQTQIPDNIIQANEFFFLSVIASGINTASASASVVLQTLKDDITTPVFSKQNYEGTYFGINNLMVEDISLLQGFDNTVRFELEGEFRQYFSFNDDGNDVKLSLASSVIPEDVIFNEKYFILNVKAEKDLTVGATATVIIGFPRELTEPIEMSFSKSIYKGSLENGQFSIEPIILTEGFTDDVNFNISGEHGEYFKLADSNNNVLNVELLNEISESVIESNNFLTFEVIALRERATTAIASVVIDIVRQEPESPKILLFSKKTYVGSFINNVPQIPVLSLQEPFNELLNLTITGEYGPYFSIEQETNEFIVSLPNGLPEEALSNTFITLDVEAAHTNAINGYATIVLEIVKESTPLVPVFERAYYTGEYSNQDGLLFEHSIQLIQGFEESVHYALDGDDAVWFDIVPIGNSVILTTKDGTIEVADRSHLVFSVVAENNGTLNGQAAIIIELADYSEATLLGFEKTSYMGSIEDNVSTLEPITLLFVYNNDVNFALLGDLNSSFSVIPTGNTVSVSLTTAIPEQLIPSNGIIFLELRASAPQAIPAHATVVFYIIRQDVGVDVLKFGETYYTGDYIETEGLRFEHNLLLSEGHTDDVQYYLEGDQSQWFGLMPTDSTLTLTLPSPLPAAVISNNQHLLFAVIAEKTGAVNATTTIVISLPTDYSEATLLGFEKTSYMGSIEDTVSTLEPITLIEGYNDDVNFALLGDLNSSFSVIPNGNTVSVSLTTAIPEQLIPSNGIIFLELRASAPQAIPAHATVVFYIIRQDVGVDVLKFGETYYTGDYIETEGLRFEHNLLLSEGHTDDVQYYLEGDQSQWFGLLPTDSTLTLTLPSPLPAAVISNNQHLLFAVIAEKTGAVNATTTIVISLPRDYSEATLLGFEKTSYMGSIEDTVSTLEPITLIEGYNDDVNFALLGDLNSSFSVIPNGNTVSVSLTTAIPEQLIPSNGIIFLELRASAPQAIPAHATVVFYIIRQDVGVDVLKFGETYYTGDYIETEGLRFEHNLLLSEGHTDDVQYYLEGDQSQWFGLLPTDSTLTLTLPSPLPAAVISNNQHLLFAVIAEKTGAVNATTTIVISLPRDYSEATLLGFEKTSYMGSIEDTVSTLEPITLIEGYNDDVNFALLGDLNSSFSVIPNGNTVSVSLTTTIPEQLIPSNGIIFLELRASAPQAIPAHATVVFYIIRQDVGVDVLKFGETYYTGDYIETEGLRFEHNLLLSEGHTDDVQYYLEGDQSQWFGLLPTDSTLTLTLPSPLPAAVISNNQHLLFAVIAEKTGAVNATTTIVISLPRDYSEATLLGFEKTSYMGSIEDTVSTLEPITLIEGYNDDVNFALLGDLNSSFSVIPNGNTVSVSLTTAIPEQLIPSNGIIFLELRASAPQAIPAHATVVFYIIRQDVGVDVLKFGETYYTGDYIETEGLRFEHNLLLSEGHTDDVQYYLEGDQSQWFGLMPTDSTLTLTLPSPLPAAVISNNQHLLFAVIAEKTGAVNATTTIVISLPRDYSEATLLGFEKTSYMGSIEDTVSTLEPITLIEGYNDDVNFALLGDLNSSFSVIPNGNTVSVSLTTAIPEQLIPSNGIIFLELRASAPQAIPAHATVVFYIIRQDVGVDVLKFGETYYTGDYIETEGLRFEHNLLLSEGHTDDVQYYLEGDQSQWFGLLPIDSTLTLTLPSPLPAAVISNNQHLLFAVIAEKTGAVNATTTIVISLPRDYSEATLLGFEKTSYMGSIEDTVSTLEPITLIEGYNDDVNFALLGDLNSSFSVIPNGNTVSVSLTTAIPEQLIPSNGIIFLELRASAPQAIPAHATVVFYIIRQDVGVDVLKFGETYYTGDYIETEGLRFEHNLLLSEGHTDDVQYYLEGDQSQWFRLLPTDSTLTLTLPSPLPAAVISNNQHLLFAVIAAKTGAVNATTTIVIALPRDTSSAFVNFSKNVYEGLIQNGELVHEAIIVMGYDGNEIPLFGEYANLFTGSVENGVVTIQSTGPLTFPDQVPYVALELRAGGASAVLILKVVISEIPTLPTVSFSSPSYVFRVEIDQTGDIGRVQATADNGEPLIYSAAIENVHLQQRLSMTSEGNVLLTAPVDSGIYSFQIIATTTISRVEGQTTVQLFVEAATMCGNEIVVPPLLILDRDEEEPHSNLVVLNGTQFAGCQYTLTNRWPENQQWLYVDENGLHAHSINREDESIAFMALSQVQVELVLQCENDTNDMARTRLKRDATPRLNWLGPYDYENNKWILTDTILYNSRRTLVNLIVNDINDNVPVFSGKDNEPIAVGYPIEELEGTILPRALAELVATDADIGENAALRYWSSDDTLSVAPTTGFVHVKNGARLEHGSRYTVNATDRNGDGLTGSIDLLVRLLDMSHIVVMTVQDAFLNDESTILNELSNAVGYEVKALKSVVVSNNSPDSNDVRSRIKREITSSNGTSLQIYVYGLIEREPVEVDKLTSDINNNTITASIESTVPLKDHLTSHQTHSGRDTGLLVSTIVLSVLLFILIVAIALWYILKWRKDNYDQFSDENSLESRKDSVQDLPKAEAPRLNIEELKRSERRLQEMLDAPVEVAPTASTSKKTDKEETSLPRITFDPATPIVFQDKLKAADESEDEFGEIQKDRRKSVVTFNENVEKIIHIDDNIDTESLPDYEVFRF